MSRTDVSHTSESGLIPDTPTNFAVVKKNQRLQVIDKDGNVVYCPPDILRRTYTRDDFEKMIDDANQNGKLSGELLTEFESKFRSRRVPLMVPEGTL